MDTPAYMLPGNNPASALFERQWELYSAEIKQNARDDNRFLTVEECEARILRK